MIFRKLRRTTLSAACTLWAAGACFTATAAAVPGIGITLDENARVTGAAAGNRSLKVRPAPFVTLCPAGSRNFLAPKPIGGNRKTSWKLRFQPARTTVELRMHAAGSVLHFHCNVNGDPGPDRGLLLRCALPFDAVGWKWYDDMQTARTIVPGTLYENVHPLRAWPDLPEWRDKPDLRLGYSNRNFCTVLAGPAGICLAVPLDHPCIFRTAYDAKAKQLEILFDFALSPATAVPNHAEFAFDIYACDPAWGFRAALARYYRLYPQFFRVFVKHPGQWMAFTRLSRIDNANEFLFGLQEGAPEPEYDDKIGVLSATYFTHAGMYARIPGYDPEKDPLPPYPVQLAAMKAAFKRATGTTGLFQASGLFGPDGRFAIRKTSVYGHIIAQFNLDPDLPYGAWTLKRALKQIRDYRDKRHARLDGFYYDGLASGINYRRAHFKTAAAPCLWDPVRKKAFLNNFFSSCKFARAAAEMLRPRGRITMMNGALQASFFVAPWLDLFGAETGLRIPREQFNYIRTVTWHKPFLTLLKGNYEKKIGHAQIELFMKRCLAYGVFPGFFDWPPSGLGPGGRYWDHPAYYERDRALFRKYEPLCRALAEAGWEPVTRARCATPGVYVERFGPGPDHVLWLTLLNETGKAVTSTLEINAKRLGLAPGTLEITERISENSMHFRPRADGVLEVPVSLPADGVLCLEVARAADAAGERLAAAQAVLDRGMRMREVESAKPAVPVHWRPQTWQAGARESTPHGPVLAFNPRNTIPRVFSQWVMLFQKAPRPLFLRVRVSAQSLAAARGRAGVRCRMAWVSPSFTHYRTVFFDFPPGTYGWRDLEFPLRSSHPLRAVLAAPTLARGVRGKVRIARISLQDASGHEFAVDPDLTQWYEPLPAALRPRIESACRALRDTLAQAQQQAGAPRALRPLLSTAARRAAALRDLIRANHAENAGRRVLRDLASVREALAAAAPWAFGFPAPELEAPAAAPAGARVHLTFRVPGAAAIPGHCRFECPGARIQAAPNGADLEIPATARPGSRLHVRAVFQIGRGPSSLELMRTRDIAVKSPVAWRAWVRTVDALAGTCRIAVEVDNNTRGPLRPAIRLESPPNWRGAITAKPARPVAPGKTGRFEAQLQPGAGAEPGETRVLLHLNAAGRALDKALRFTYIPKTLNRVRNPGFEQGLRYWSHTKGDVRTAAAAISGQGCVAVDNPGTLQSTVSQSVRLAQALPCPIIVRAASRAQDVRGAPGRGYSLYVDLYYTDGTPLYGTTYDFPTGNADWNSAELVIEPEKPIRNANIYLLLRGRHGRVWFDDVALMEDPDRKGNLARTAAVSVDSCFSHYTSAPITDGRVRVAGLHWSKQAWASADNEKPHFVLFHFQAPQSLCRGTIYWAVDAGRTETSQEVDFQVELPHGGWRTLARIRPAAGARKTRFQFPKTRGSRFRLFQPAGKGPRNRPGILWLREIELFATP